MATAVAPVTPPAPPSSPGSPTLKFAIAHKKSYTSGNIPDPARLEIGELAINFADKKIYSKDASGNIVELGFNADYDSDLNALKSVTDGGSF
jgi:hypothetical protein